MNKTPARRLRELLAAPGPVLSPGVYDCISAKIVERAGFPVAAISGAGLSASLLGYPDVGLTTMTEVVTAAHNIARSVDIPVTVDADTGYGNAVNLIRATKEFEAAGLAGMMIEDQVFPKRCGQLEGKKVIPKEEMVGKIKAACDARRDDDFVIIGRSDARAPHGMEEAIERCVAYAEAGADVIFVDAMLSLDDMRRLSTAVDKPTKTNMVEGGKTPAVHYNELHEVGIKIIAYASLVERAAIRAGLDILELLKEKGTARSAYPERIVDLVERNELMGLAQFYALEEQLFGPLMESEGSWRSRLEEQAARQARPSTWSPV